MGERHPLRHWAIARNVSDHRFGGPRGPQPGSLMALSSARPLVSFHTCLPMS